MIVGWHYLPGGEDDPFAPLAASTFLDLAPTAGMRSPERLVRPYFKGRPDPGVVAQRASEWHQRGCRAVIGNEPNLASEQFGGGPSDYGHWFMQVRVKVPGVRLYYAGMSPGVEGWRDWYVDDYVFHADGIAAHAYGTFDQMRAVVEELRRFDKPLWLAEVNFGAGQQVDRDAWADQHLRPFLDWCSTVPQVEAVTYFCYRWPTPDTPTPTPVDGAGTRIETVLRSWRPPQEESVTIKGIDVSNHQGAIDWAAVARAGVAFAAVKASGDEGATDVFLDPFFPENWRQANAAGLARIAYHYCRPSRVAPAASVTTLERALAAVEGLRAGDNVALDVEDPDVPDGTSLHVWVAEWLDLAERVFGVAPFKYSARYYTRAHDLEHDDLARYPTWWAAYQAAEPAGVAGWKPIRIWQHSASGTVPGVVGAVDLDVFHGMVADLRALGLPAPPAVDWETPVLGPIWRGASAVAGMPDATPADESDATEIIRRMDSIKSRHPAA